MKPAFLFRSAAAVVVMAYGVSAGLAAGPRTVWCHKADGRVDLEFETAPEECGCEKCALCREHCLLEMVEPGPGKTTLKALHCSHEEILPDPAGGIAVEKRVIHHQSEDGSRPKHLSADSEPFSSALHWWTEGSFAKAPPPVALSLRC